MFQKFLWKKSVGGLLFTNFEATVGLTAFVQVRGRLDHQLNKNSYPGGCQATVHRNNVSFFRSPEYVLMNAIREDLGGQFAHQFKKGRRSFGGFQFVTDCERDGTTFSTFAIRIPFHLIDLIRLRWTDGGLRMIHHDRLSSIEDLTQYDKNEGVADRETIALFPDEAKAIRVVFANPDRYLRSAL